MFNFDNTTNENNEEHNLKWPNILDHAYGILIIGSVGSGKTNVLLNLIKEKYNDILIDNIYLYAKYQLLIKKWENE